MKKLILLVLALLTVMGNLAWAQSGPEVPVSTTPTSSTLATETINNINVPYTILLDAQMVFQGFAVTEARQYRRSGQEVYALRMDNSDTNRSAESFYLLFTTNWQYIGREQAPPPAPKSEAPKPEEQPQEDRGSERPEEPAEETEEQVDDVDPEEEPEQEPEPETNHRPLRD